MPDKEDDFSKIKQEDDNKKNINHAYWLKKLSGDFNRSRFQYDYKGNVPNVRIIDSVEFRFSGEIFSNLLRFSQESDIKLYKVLTAGLISLLGKYSYTETGLKDIMIGAPVLFKQSKGTETKPVNSILALRCQFEENITFKDMCTYVGKIIDEANEHEDFSVEDLPGELGMQVFGDDFPLFDTAISLENIQDRRYIRHLNFNMIFSFFRAGDYIDGVVEYNASLFEKDTIRNIIGHFTQLLISALSDVHAELYNINIVTSEEKKKLLEDFNDTKTVYPMDKTIHELFEAQVEKTPGNIALTYKGQQLTYQQLNEKANQLARILRNKGVKPDHIVTVMDERSIDMIIGIMAILKAGGAFLPLDPDCPEERVQQRVEENESHLLLTMGKYAHSIDFDADLIFLEKESIYYGNKENLECVNSPKNLAAYVIYISTYMRNPKGVMIEHGAVINTLFFMQSKYPVRESDIYLLKTPFKSTVSISELFGWFLGSGQMHILEKGAERDTGKILEVIHEQRITHINLIPTMFNQMVNQLASDHQYKEKISQLRYIFLSMEPIAPEIINKFRKLKTEVFLVNLYSRTEAAIYSTSYPISEWPRSGSIPIGKPINNMKMYILNFIKGRETPEVMPMGIPGELCISGIGLARGYIKKEKLTAEKFIDNPFAADKDQDDYYKKIYRTGDLARWLPDGNIEFLGRIEREIMIKGTRIDRTEVESHLLKQEKIKEAVVVAREVAGEKYMCAYIVSDETLNTKKVRETLAKSLPAPMIPLYFIQIDQIPLTPEGKANRGELLDFKQAPHQIEEILAEIEAEVLNLNKDEIDLDANFFTLGGHSLKAAQVAEKIQKVLNVEISMAEIFKRPTLRQLSEFLTEAVEVKYAAIQPAEKKEYHPQSSHQKRLYFLHQMDKDDTTYNLQVMDIYCKGFEKEKLEDAFKKLIQRHDSLRTSFHMVDDELVQKICDFEEAASEFEIEYYETSEDGKIRTWTPGKERNRKGIQMEGVDFQEVIRGVVRPFVLDRAPLLRVCFIKIWGRTKILIMDMHHIVTDGISMEILVKELWQLYDGEPLAPLRLQYKDFSRWLNSEHRVEAVKEHEKYWFEEFSGEIPLINLPLDYPRPALMSFEGESLQFEIGREETRQLNDIAKNQGDTLYMVLFAVYNVLLAKITGQEDIVVGTLTSGRGHDDLRNVVGMFLNTLALRNYPEGEKTFESLLLDIKINTFAALENQDYPFEKLVSKVASREDISRNPLFDVSFGLVEAVDDTGYLVEVTTPGISKHYDLGTRNSKFDMSLICVEVEGKIECSFEFKTGLFKQETIARFIGYFKKILSTIYVDLYQKISEIEIITEEEKNQILYEFNDTRVDYPIDKTIHELFEECVEKTPGNTALTYKGDQLPYREVNEKANQLAVVLRKKGVKPENMVGIMVERTMEMIVGIFAILKAGGTYLPIDPNYPADRIRFLFKDSSAKLLLTLTKFVQFAKTVDFAGEVIDMEDESLYQGDDQNVLKVNSPRDLAYIIYTSGSTGKPKGVAIEHISAVNLLYTLDRLYPLEEDHAYLLKTAFLFDVSVSEIFGWFWRGGRLVILEQGGEREPLMIIDVIEEEKVTHINFVPSLFNIFVDILDNDNKYKISSLKYIFLAGEAIWPESIIKFRELKINTYIDNLYGPTEATVYASWYPVAKWKGIGNVSIGRPVDNLKLCILSSEKKERPVLNPVGIAGELTIMGIQLARGYLNRPELTTKMFVDNPFASEEGWDKSFKKLYKTGDLCRWYSDGDIEYMGRIDSQVKVRGFRIELGEIETQLLNFEEINEAIVIVRKDKEGKNYLCSYIISDKPLNVASIRERLSQKLPDYMIPSYFVEIEKIPLNPNGKLDRKALPEPIEEIEEREYTAPTNEIEEIITRIWANVLGIKQVGIDDNFFEIGGDSINAIQIVSKVQKQQLRMQVSQIFLYKTVKELAKYIKPIEVDKIRVADQGIIEGKLGLSPIQQWLFTDHFPHCYNFNQSLIMYRKAGFDENYIRKIFSKIVQHHDTLRMVFQYEDSPQNVEQENKGIKGKLFDLEVIPLDKEKDERAAVKGESARIQDGINLKTGPLVKLGLFKGSHGDHLLIVINHLVVDGISWRILQEDFEAGYQQLLEGKELVFPDKTDSFKCWSETLHEYANSSNMLKELPLWKKLEEVYIGNLPADHKIAMEERKFKHKDNVTMILSEEKTRQLLSGVHRAYNTEINDILLTGVGLAVKQWANLDKVLVKLEGHGREMIVENIDITRTIGWFTIQYPVLLDMENSGDISFSIKNVKETLRKIPNKGIGYGILKYLTPREKKESIRFKQNPQILFNYLGKFGSETYGVIDEIYGMTDLSLEDWCNPEMTMEPKIDIEGIIADNRLKLYLIFSKLEYERESIEQFSDLLKTYLDKVIDHCMEKEEPECTPSDFGYKHLSIKELDQLTNYIKTNIKEETEIQSIYPLNPMQTGMLFLWLENKKSHAYFVQYVFTIKGEIENSMLESSLNKLIARYDILRTIFAYEELDKPLQIVLKERKPHFYFDDIVHLDEDQQVKYLEEYRAKEKKKGFDLCKDHLVKFSLFKTGLKSYRLIMSFHHILMDGWCIHIIQENLTKIYHSLIKGAPIELEPVTPYGEYINWLEREDKESGLNYWKNYLEGFDEPTGLPKKPQLVKEGEYEVMKYHFTLDEELVTEINKLSAKHMATMNTVLQTAWGVLLQKYNNRNDVVFGNVVSGRAVEIEGIDRMIGLFINMIPVRINGSEGEEFLQLLTDSQEASALSKAYEYLSIAEIQSLSSLKGDLIDHIIASESYPEQEELEETEFGFTIEGLEVYEQTNYNFNVIFTPGTCVKVIFNYNSLLYDMNLIENIALHFLNVVRQIVDDPHIEIRKIEIITDDDKKLILDHFNDTQSDYPGDKTINELFEAVVKKYPDKQAVVGMTHGPWGTQLAFKELNAKVNQLAAALRSKGMQPEDAAAIMVEPCQEMIIGLMGILKAGGAFLPIDPKIPADRIKYILEESGTQYLLTQKKLLKGITYKGDIINLDNADIYKGKEENLPHINTPKDMAYIIYTSGSTGKPKGVVVEHCSLINLCSWHNKYYSVTTEDHATKYAGFGFDASVWEVFPYLIIGATLYIVPEEIKFDIHALNRYFEENRITISFLPTQLCEQFMTIENNSLRALLTGGDKLKTFVEKNYQLYNNYGPTENTVVTTSCPVTELTTNIPIGKPLDNNQIYILSSSDNLQPIGAAGELCIGGDSLARGYLNKPFLTREKFVQLKDKNWLPAPVTIYRTGDLSRWLWDGDIEFLGRIDYQVKVRGFRIELGEIENQLLQFEDIKEAVVMAREDASGQKYLCAYIVPGGIMDTSDIKERLAKNLPDYMVPSYFVQIEKMPLNPNGKIDTKALPAPEAKSVEYAAPTNETEKILVEAWTEILGIEKVGIDDNFFDVGGDSIKTILISGKLLKRKLSTNVNEFFSYPTIRQLAKQIKKVERVIDQGPVSGEVILTPILKWFFERDFREKHHFNHFVLQYSKENYDEETIKKVFAKIVQHHDALRMVYIIDEKTGKVLQRNREPGEGKLFDLEFFDLTDKTDAEVEREKKKNINRINREINLSSGPLVKLSLFRTSGGDYLLVVIHHAVVDGISWRILVEDLETGYQQVEKGEEIKFQDKTDSFKDWAYKLKEYADSSNSLKELEYWKAIEETAVKKLPVDHKVGKETRTLGNQDKIIMELNIEETEKLLKEVNFVYNTEINDILLTALGMAVKEWTGNEKVLINLEGHGREKIIEDIDISRTVGWFTSQYPLLLDMKTGEGEDLAYQIKKVKQTLRQVPNKGIGYGILKYLTSSEKKSDLEFKLQPEISFNYLGQLGETGGVSTSKFHPHFEPSLTSEYNGEYALDIYGSVGKDGLSLGFHYNKCEYKRTSIEKLVKCYKTNLLKIIDHCMKKKKEILEKGMSALDYNIKKDTERYLQKVKTEEWPDLTFNKDFRHILLTGSTGFLGAHLVFELLENTNATLYLPVRAETQKNAEERLKARLAFYFGDDLFKSQKHRLVALKSELSEDKLALEDTQYEKLSKTVEAVVHSAANVKHFGLYEELYKDNVLTTERLLEFSLTGKKKDFHYISTLDTGYGNIPGKDYLLFTEYCLDEGQEIDNIYLKTKFEAEKLVQGYRTKGVNGSIYRVGNLIFQSSTGKFQENIQDDYFYAIIRGAVKLEMLSDKMKKIVFDMSFIDYTAKAIVLLLTKAQLKNEIYHLCNPHELPMTEMAGFLKELGFILNDVKEHDVEDYLSQFAGKSEYDKIIELLKHHSWIFEEKEGTKPVYKLDRTVMLLKKLGYKWPKVTKNHIERMIAHSKEVGFL